MSKLIATMNKICNLKTCKHKGAPQAKDCFYKNMAYDDGLEKRCKDCSKASVKKHNDKRAEGRRFEAEYFL
jgi:hypothetical protein